MTVKNWASPELQGRVTMIVTDEEGNRYRAEQHILPGNVNWSLTPIPKEYRFGSIVLVETGEVRQARTGEFYLWREIVRAWSGNNTNTVDAYPILKPVRIEE